MNEDFKVTQKKEKRYAEVRYGNEWFETPFQEIMKDDEFKLYEPDGRKVVNSIDKKSTIFLATSDAYQRNEDGEWTVNCDPVK